MLRVILGWSTLTDNKYCDLNEKWGFLEEKQPVIIV